MLGRVRDKEEMIPEIAQVVTEIDASAPREFDTLRPRSAYEPLHFSHTCRLKFMIYYC